jgi:hypothetical protein
VGDTAFLGAISSGLAPDFFDSSLAMNS